MIESVHVHGGGFEFMAVNKLAGVLQGRFVPVALEAQGLEVQGLCREGLVHGDDVVALPR